MSAKPLDPSHGVPVPTTSASASTVPPERRHQILDAAMTCFARRGFHQTTMHDISEAAGISVGLIYRYFESKDQVISTMATEHLQELHRKIDEARALPSLSEGLEHVLWCDHEADVAASFVVDLFAESSRNDHVRALVHQIHDASIRSVTDLIAASPDAARLAPGVSPGDAAEMLFHAIHGRLFGEILAGDARSASEMKRDRVEALRRMLTLLLPADGPTAAVTPR